MVKTLKKTGNSYALPMDKATMEAMNITPDTPLMITLSEGKMTVVAANLGFSDDEIDEFFGEIRPKYDKMLQNLAK
jgi:antitoxin component of MazEF toxin-antitoxin module